MATFNKQSKARALLDRLIAELELTVVVALAYVGAMVASIGQEGEDMKVGLSDGRSILTTDIVKWLAI